MIRNTAASYGRVARFFHWSIALLVLLDLGLGVIGKYTLRSGDTVGFLQLLYSTHKTIGVTVLALAVLRVIWAVAQPRPLPLHPERRLEPFAAETAHWVLYAAIFLLPLSGWVIHSAEVGFAPIWWPFAQDLPFIPKSERLAELAANVHWIAGIVLAATVAAHIGGALKHALIDRDSTLARMWNGRAAGDAKAAHAGKAASTLAAMGVWAIAIGGALTVFASAHEGEIAARQPAQSTAGWVVQEGRLAISVTQMGAEVTGGFANWDARIEYDPDSGAGTVRAVIDTTSLKLGSVTEQAKGPEFFDVAAHDKAVFEGDIRRVGGSNHSATGALTLVGQTVPVTLDFDLDLADGRATVSGSTALDRRDFGMGAGYPDESTVGFSVKALIELVATKAE